MKDLKTDKKHANIPIFIPHLGCPNDCVFCNQRTISGHGDFKPETVRDEIETALATIGDRTAEIAFFGGSFTGIDRSLMVYLLDLAEEYVKAGKVVGIRLSTRPDYINGEIIEILSRYTITAVELGIQSTSDKVLAASRRGHTAEQSKNACLAVKKAGFTLVGQMMIGLPSSDAESEIKTAEDICSWGATFARVYPTVVFYKTELCRMSQVGEYQPLSDDEAIERTANVLDVFDRHGVKTIRVGLCAGENLSSEKEVYGGANHPAIGELAMQEVFFRKICEAYEKLENPKKELTLCVPRGCISKAVGQKRHNILRFSQKYSANIVKIIEKSDVFGYNVILY